MTFLDKLYNRALEELSLISIVNDTKKTVKARSIKNDDPEGQMQINNLQIPREAMMGGYLQFKKLCKTSTSFKNVCDIIYEMYGVKIQPALT